MIVIDTHVWVWWSHAPERLSAAAGAALESADAVGLSPISCWEVGMLVVKGRLTPDRPITAWTERALSRDRLQILPLTAEIAVEASQLTTLHGDPADRIIVATAQHHRATLITRDERITRAAIVPVLWRRPPLASAASPAYPCCSQSRSGFAGQIRTSRAQRSSPRRRSLHR